MKKYVLIAIAVLVVIMLAVMLTDTPYEDVNVSGETSSTSDEPTGSGSHTLAEAEALLGISLPENSIIDILLDGDYAAGVLGYTALSLEETQAHFEAEMSDAGYSDSRPWGLSPGDSDRLQSATFTGNGETWAIILTDEGEATTFDIQRQY